MNEYQDLKNNYNLYLENKCLKEDIQLLRSRIENNLQLIDSSEKTISLLKKELLQYKRFTNDPIQVVREFFIFLKSHSKCTYYHNDADDIFIIYNNNQKIAILKNNILHVKNKEISLCNLLYQELIELIDK